MNHDLLNDPSIDSYACTYDGARLKNPRDFSALTFAEKLEVIEGLNDFARSTLESLQRCGRPYLDPYTGQLVRPSPPARSRA